MDLQAMMDGGSGGRGGPWTEERHSSFLNWMEESFVRRMLAGAGFQASCSATCNCRSRRCRCRHLPLDRYLPDSATESTRDFHGPRRSSGTGRPMRSPVSVDEEEEEPASGNLAITGDGRRARKRPLPRYDASQDQVVPQLGNAEVDDSNSKNQTEAEGGILTVSPTSHSWGKKGRGRRDHSHDAF
ncbi:uncharacterized protein LOC103714165 [Phoenix dactylifera]|uniref:Uncharacterized protein LOC103714165 n=1 Tax=Phoenix dactylifera TaxID=42345 RepID=A0A8B7CI35_PHODC|nr:uncharacterized protein LOC103714165 [Phoenix dactylifera]